MPPRPRFSHRISLALIAAVILLAPVLIASQSAPDKNYLDAAARIRDAAMNHSQVMDTVAYLTDVIGPRLTGSPNHKRAAEYARDKLREWGLANAHLESWNFGRGWELTAFTANVISPTFSPLIAYPKAWSPSTNGTVRGDVVFFDPKTFADLDQYKGKLRGKIVLFSPAREIDPLFIPQSHRQSDEDLARLASAPPPEVRAQFQMSPEQLRADGLNRGKWQLLQTEGSAAVLQPSFSDAGTVYVTSATISYPMKTPPEKRFPPWDLSKPTVVPQVVVAAEQYNRLLRFVARGVPVQLEINIAARFIDSDPMSYNVIAEIPGSDLKDEVVMIGGSLDSWHSAEGATDNAVGAATAMEVVRIIQSLGLKPRRTIRIALWSAEEQGTLGSRAYVAAHFGHRVSPPSTSPAQNLFDATPEWDKFEAYFNLDYGTGRIRGIYMQGNELVRPIFQKLLAPLNDLGASTLTLANIGAPDHMPFEEIGLPGFQFIRDYMEGNNTRAPHTNMDTIEHVLGDDLKQSAAVAASVIYGLSMSSEKLPRKPRPWDAAGH
jgi:carboxypeptidase Q